MVLVYHEVPVGCDAFLTGSCSLVQASSAYESYLGGQVLVGYSGSGAADVGAGTEEVDVEAEDSCVGSSGVLGVSVGLQDNGVLLATEHGGASRVWSVELLVWEVLVVDMQGCNGDQGGMACCGKVPWCFSCQDSYQGQRLSVFW